MKENARSYTHFFNRLTALFLSIAMITGLVSAAGTVSDNIGDNNYGFYSYASQTVKSYLFDLGDGRFERVEYVGTSLIAEIYDGSFNYVSGKTIAAELPVFGGCYFDGTYHYVVTGQNNTEENENKEVFRVTKYNNSWTRLGSAGLYGANTTVPFDAGSLRMTMSGNMLYILTCHEMYADDGVNHQANVFIAFNTSTMKITDSYTNVMNLKQAGYVSHSFNQFIICDEGKVLTVNHGDANGIYPCRAIVLASYPHTAGEEVITPQSYYENCDYAFPMSFSSSSTDHYSVHYNNTGCDIGGFEATSSNYIVAGNSILQNGVVSPTTGLRNVFVTVTPKSGNLVSSSSTVKWLTNYVDGTDTTKVGNPQMVKISDSRLLVMWNETTGSDVVFKYCFLDASGNISGSVYSSATGRLSDCKPIVVNNKVVWYSTSNSVPAFFEIDISSPASVKMIHEHGWQLVFETDPTPGAEGTGYVICGLCGEKHSITAPPLSVTADCYTAEALNSDWNPASCGENIEYYRFTYTDPVYGVSKAFRSIWYSSAWPSVKEHDRISHAAVEPTTCTGTGTAAYYECSSCHKIFSDYNMTQETTLAALTYTGDHSWSSSYTIDKAATCTEDGSKSIHCTKCNATKDAASITKLGHFVETWTATTGSCEEGGTRSGTCVRCGETVTIDMEPVGHQWSDFIVDVPATCTAAGVKSKHCSNCGERSEITPITKLDHNWSDWSVKTAGNCVTRETQARTCSLCGTEETRDGSYGDHVWNNDYTVDKPATCTAEGSKSIHCTKCDATKNTTPVPADGHTFGQWEKAGNIIRKKCVNCTETELISRIYGDSRYDTSIEVAEMLRQQGKFENVVVAGGEAWPDALAGSYLAGKKNAPVLLVADGRNLSVMNKMTDYIKENLADDGRIYVLGGTGAVSANFEKVMGPEYADRITRLAGRDRYETNIMILREAEVSPGDDILVCTGTGFADSLSASATKRPILLVPGNRILVNKFVDQTAFLKSLGTDHKIYIIGGVGAVTPAVQDALSELGFADIRRLSGQSRYQTSAAVAIEFFSKPAALVLSYGVTAPDGLSAGPLAAEMGVPLLLAVSADSVVGDLVAYRNSDRSDLEMMFVTGGSMLVSDEAAERVYEGE